MLIYDLRISPQFVCVCSGSGVSLQVESSVRFCEQFQGKPSLPSPLHSFVAVPRDPEPGHKTQANQYSLAVGLNDKYLSHYRKYPYNLSLLYFGHKIIADAYHSHNYRNDLLGNKFIITFQRISSFYLLSFWISCWRDFSEGRGLTASRPLRSTPQHSRWNSSNPLSWRWNSEWTEEARSILRRLEWAHGVPTREEGTTANEETKIQSHLINYNITINTIRSPNDKHLYMPRNKHYSNWCLMVKYIHKT